MKLIFHGTPFPRWTAHSAYPFVNTVKYEYFADGRTDIVFEQYFSSDRFGFTRRCSWLNEADQALLRQEGKAMGLNIKSDRDLDTLSSAFDSPCFALHATDSDNRSVMVILPSFQSCGLDPNGAGDVGFAETVTAEDAKLDAIAATEADEGQEY